MAGLALDPHVGEEVHLDLLLAVALARLAAAALLVEAESPGRVAAHLRLRQPREQLADEVEHAGVGRGVRRRRVAERVLIDVDNLVDVLQPAHVVVRRTRGLCAVQLAGERVVQHLVDQRRLAGATDPSHRQQRAERQVDIDVAEVVLPRPEDADRQPQRRTPRHFVEVQRRAGNFGVPAAAHGRHRDGDAAGQVLAGERVLGRLDLRRRAVSSHLAALVARAGAEVEQVVGRGDHLAVVLDEQERVAEVAEALQRPEQSGVVARVQADRRLVEDVQDTREAGADLRRQADALGLTAGERRPLAVEAQVVEADIDEELQAGDDLLADLVDHFEFALRQRRRSE